MAKNRNDKKPKQKKKKMNNLVNEQANNTDMQ